MQRARRSRELFETARQTAILRGMSMPSSADLGTHNVENQPVPQARQLWDGDAPLREAIVRHGGDTTHLAAYSATIGAEDMVEAGRAANRYPPEAQLFDRGGRRLDEVRFHPAYHGLMKAGLEAGYAALPWTGGRHVTHAAMVYLTSQVEPGVCCPMTMTYAGVPAIMDSPLAAQWLPKLTARAYDPSVAPVAGKRAATLGMAMTEKQGGSDVRANTTRADRAGEVVAPDRAQVVLLGADVGRVPHAGAGARRADLFSRAALVGGRAQRDPPDAAEGQARQPRQRLGGDRICGRPGLAARRGGAGGRDHHRDGASHPARHRARSGRPDARGAGRGRLVV